MYERTARTWPGQGKPYTHNTHSYRTSLRRWITGAKPTSLPPAKVPGSQAWGMGRTSYNPVSSAQQRLRRQLISGNCREVLTACGFPSALPSPSTISALTSWLSKFITWATFRPARLDFIYTDDLGATAVAYLATGSRIVDAKRIRPPDTTSLVTFISSAWFGTGPLSYRGDTARARTLEHLLVAGLRPDLSCITDNANTLLHCCLLNGGSPAVLVLLLERLPADYPKDLKPRLQIEDAEGHTALELAVHLGQWEAVGLLLRAGALQGSSKMSQALSAMRRSIPASSPPLAPLPSLASTSVLPSSLSILGRRALSILPFGSRLRLRSGSPKQQQQQQQQQQQCGATGSGGSQPTPSAPEMSRRLRALLTAGTQEQQQGEGCSSGVKVLAPADVSKGLEEAVILIQDMLNVEEEVALSLLVDCDFDVDAAIQHGRAVVSAPEVPHASTSAAGEAAAGGGTSQGAGEATATCMICFEEQASEASLVRLQCSHPEVACAECWRKFIMERVDEGRPFTIACPWPGCAQLLTLKQLQSLVSPEQLDRIKAQRASHFVAVHARTTWCPRPGCEAAVKVQGHPAAGASAGSEGADPDPEKLLAALQSGRGVGVACSCGWRFCFQCKASPAHEPASCAQYAAWKQVQAQLQKDLSACSEDWMRENTKACPRCAARIQKAGGCLHMHCRNCQHHFCWLCMQPFLPGTGRHQDPFACLGYTQQATPSSAEAPGSLYEALGALWGRMTASALRKRQEHHMRRYLAFSGGGARDAACITRMRLLLSSATLGHQPPGKQGSSNPSLEPSLLVHGMPAPAALSLPLHSWWQRWQDALTSGREVLANSYILAYFTSDPVALRSLGYLQAQLVVLLEALAAPLAALPGAAVLAPVPSASTGPDEQAGLWQALSALAHLWTGPGSGGSGSGSSGAQLASLDGVHGPEAAEQLFFSVALLQERRATVEALVRETNRFTLALVRAARSGLFASSSEGKALGTLDVILGSMM